jgi:hypothetical protein
MVPRAGGKKRSARIGAVGSPVWTELGAPAPQPVKTDAAAAAPRPTLRLRRHQRPILGALDTAGATLQRHAREALLGPGLLLVPLAILDVIVSNLVYDRFASFDDAVVSLPEFVGGVDSATGAETLLAYVAIVTASLATAVVGGYATVLVLRRSNGLPVTLRPCLAGTVRRLHVLVIAWVIGHVWMVLGSLVLVQLSAGDLAPLALLAAPIAAFLVIVTLSVSPVIVAERAGVFRALRRSARLVRLRPGSATGLVALSILLGGGLRALITWMPQMIEATGFLTFAGATWLAEGVAGQIAPLVVVPWIALATANLYLQVRMDAEGLDLLVESERIF